MSTCPPWQVTPYHEQGVYVTSQPVLFVQDDPLVPLYRSTSAWHSAVGISVTLSQKAKAPTSSGVCTVGDGSASGRARPCSRAGKTANRNTIRANMGRTGASRRHFFESLMTKASFWPQARRATTRGRVPLTRNALKPGLLARVTVNTTCCPTRWAVLCPADIGLWGCWQLAVPVV